MPRRLPLRQRIRDLLGTVAHAIVGIRGLLAQGQLHGDRAAVGIVGVAGGLAALVSGRAQPPGRVVGPGELQVQAGRIGRHGGDVLPVVVPIRDDQSARIRSLDQPPDGIVRIGGLAANRVHRAGGIGDALPVEGIDRLDQAVARIVGHGRDVALGIGDLAQVPCGVVAVGGHAAQRRGA